MAFNISYVYRAIDAFSPVADKIAKSVDNIKAKVDRTRTSMREFGESMRNTGKSMTGFLTLPIAGLGIMALRSTAQLESMQVSFETLLGSGDKAKNLMATLKGFATTTPFELMDIGGAARQLIVAGVDTKDLTEKMRMLGDIASGANVPLQDMSAIFAKMKNKGKAMAEELAQMSERGIPIMRVLSEGTGKTIPELYKAAEKGAISFAIVEKAMARMAGKGGMFFNSMDKQSKTLGGIWSNVQDAISFSLASIGDNLVETFALKDTMNAFITSLNSVTAAFNNWTKQHPLLAKMLFIFTAFIAILGPVLILLGLMATGFAILLSPIGLVVAGILAITAALVAFKPIGDVFRLIFELSRLAAQQLFVSLEKIGNYLGGLMPKFEWFSKLKGDFASIGKSFDGNMSIGGAADYLSNQNVKDWNPSINSNINNNSTINGKILVEATNGAKVISTTSLGKGNKVELGTNMVGAY